MTMREKVAEKWNKSVIWVHIEFQKSMNRFAEDLRSMRIIWIWLLLALWFWVVIWGMLYYPKYLGITIVITLGGMITIVINVYIFSKGHEKSLEHKLCVAKLANGHGKPPQSADTAKVVDPGGEGNG